MVERLIYLAKATLSKQADLLILYTRLVKRLNRMFQDKNSKTKDGVKHDCRSGMARSARIIERC
jgi:hypothetical protein